MPMTATQAQQLYVAYFNRPADTFGLDYWTKFGTVAGASADFAASAEYAATYANMTVAQRVDAIYMNLFGRPAELEGLKYWVGEITAGKVSLSSAVTQIAGGAQTTDLAAYNNKVTAASAFTTALDTAAEAIAYQGTAANNAAKAWLSGVTNTASLTAATAPTALNATVASVTAASVPAVGTTPTFAVSGSAASVDEGSAVIFTLQTTNVAAGATYSYILSGVSAADVAGGALTGSVTIGSDGKALIPVTLVADAATEGTETLTITIAGKTASATVNDTSLTPAPVALNAALTGNADSGAAFTGSSANDVFNSVIVGAAATGTTLQAGDNLVGGLGSDVLNISATGAAGALLVSGVQASSMERIAITDYTDAGVLELDAALISGVTNVDLFASSATGDVKVSGLSGVVAAAMSNGSGDLELAYNTAAIASKTDVQSLAVSNITAGAFVANGVETIAITSTLTANTLTSVTGAATTSVTVAGDKGLTITGALANTVTTLDASKATGDVVVGLTAGGNVKATGGAGNDTFDFAAGLTDKDVVDGGAGSNTVKIAETANRNFTGVTLTNVQTLDFAVTTNTLTDLDIKALADSVGVTVRAGTDDKDVTVNNVGVGQVVTVANAFAATLELGDVAINLESNVGTADSVSVALSAATNVAQTLDKLTIDAGAETLSISNSGVSTAATAYTLTSLIADGAKTINFTGAGNFVTTLNESAGGANVTTTIDASSASGEFKITENVTNDMTIKGSSGQNTIVMAATLNNKDTIIGGASTKDAVSATIGSATTATTGKFNLTGVETLALTATSAQTSVVDLSASTGVTAVTVSSSAATGTANVTINGLAAGTTVSTTTTNDFDATASLTVALKDATGSNDSITIGLNNTADDDFILVAAGIETVTLSAASTGINAGSSLNVAGVAATKLVVTGGVAASGLDLTLGGAVVLNKSVSSVDTSGFSGAVKVTGSSATDASALAVNAGTFIVQNTGAVDTFIAGTTTGKVDTFAGTIGATSAAADFITQIKNFETYDIKFADGVAVTANTNEGLGDGDSVVTSIKLSGGLASSTYTATAGFIDGKLLTSFDASGLGGAISIQVDAGANSGTTSLGDLGSKLTIKGSTSATTDKVEYLANGLAVSSSSSTGKLLTSGVETVVLTTVTANSAVDAAGLVGVTTIAVENDKNVTLTNLASGTTLQLGATAEGGVDDYTGTLTYSLANEAGSSDSIKINLLDTNADNDINAVLVNNGIETLTINHGAVADSNAKLDVSGVKASSIILTGGATAEVLDLRATGGAVTLNASTSTINASAFSGTLTALANVNTATTLSAKTNLVTFVGSDLNDTVTVGAVGSEISAAITGLNLGNGTGDALTAYVKGSADIAAVTNTETINLVAAATGADYSVTATSGANGINQATAFNVTGGEAGKVVTLGGNITDHAFTLDASALAGSIAATFGVGELIVAGAADAITIKGGLGSKDQVTATFSDNAVANTGKFTMTGVETLLVNTISQGATAGADVIDLGNVSGLATLVLTTDVTNPNSVTVNGLAATGTAVSVGALRAAGQTDVQAFVGVTATLNLASATGTSDALTVNLNDTNAGASTATIVTNGVEALTLALGNTTEVHTVVLSNNTTNAATLTVTGTNTSADLTVTTLASAYTTVNAAGLAGKFVMSDGSRGSSAMTITGGTNSDTIIMRAAGDVLDGGTGTNDTLKVVANGVIGGYVIDLSSSTDQVVTLSGSANAAAQKGFESVNLSGVTGTYGADITGSTAANTIVGTANNDQISGGNGADSITGGAGNDAIDLTETTAAVDTVIFSAVASNGNDTITGFLAGANKDILKVTALATLTDTAGDTVQVASTATAATAVGTAKAWIVTDAAAADWSTVAAVLGAAMDESGTGSEKAAMLVSNGTDTRVYLFQNDGVNNAVQAGEITLVGTVTGVLAGAFDITNVVVV